MGPSPRLAVEQKQATRNNMEQSGKPNQSKHALASWLLKGKSKRVRLDSQGRAGMPSRLYRNTLSACQVLDTKEKHLSPFSLWLLSEGSQKAVHSETPQEGVQTGVGTERGNFKLNTVTVHRIEALVEKKESRVVYYSAALGDISWPVSH